jgi:hypothetical protein
VFKCTFGSFYLRPGEWPFGGMHYQRSESSLVKRQPQSPFSLFGAPQSPRVHEFSSGGALRRLSKKDWEEFTRNQVAPLGK